MLKREAKMRQRRGARVLAENIGEFVVLGPDTSTRARLEVFAALQGVAPATPTMSRGCDAPSSGGRRLPAVRHDGETVPNSSVPLPCRRVHKGITHCPYMTANTSLSSPSLMQSSDAFE